MRAITLLEQGDQNKVGQFAGRYGELAAVMDKFIGGPLLMALNNNVNYLANTSLLDIIHEFQLAMYLLPELEFHQPKENMFRALQYTLPGNRGVYFVVQVGEDNTVDPSKMVSALRGHWSRVFCRNPPRGMTIF
jgi:hypothetical protein